MNRKHFIKSTGLGLGLTLMPTLVKCQNNSDSSGLSGASQPTIVKNSEGDILNVLGDIQTHKLAGEGTGNQITEWVSNVDPGVGIPPHIHTKEDEIFRVIKGQVEIMVDGETTVLEEGDVAYAPKNIPHAWTVVGTEKAEMITSAFPAGIEIMFGELAELPEGPPDFDKVAAICANHGINFI
ncbi:cupin domain-containing protein [Zobellia alginiliquefaciens]|uniref:cupin domain-containing protein n=1 Tax=Zobellia alginiliquefaciens TaxID=3032586 RepID=UPI0023E3AB4F|nr:cupin domain-containing protein [Zobellia alginiliquefaciens]